jgi:glutaredoxin 3
MSQGVIIYTTRFCPYCVRARNLLNEKGVAYEDIAVDHDPQLRREMMTRSGLNTVPQIWIGEQHIGGCDEMMLLERQGRLDEILVRVGTAP